MYLDRESNMTHTTGRARPLEALFSTGAKTAVCDRYHLQTNGAQTMRSHVVFHVVQRTKMLQRAHTSGQAKHLCPKAGGALYGGKA